MQASFEETLKFGLKCRRQLEFDFVELVVQKVNQGQLPKDLVLSQFNWAREQNAKIPFPYFQFGMKKRAAAIGVDLYAPLVSGTRIGMRHGPCVLTLSACTSNRTASHFATRDWPM